MYFQVIICQLEISDADHIHVKNGLNKNTFHENTYQKLGLLMPLKF